MSKASSDGGSSGRYHHGGLRRALLDAALAELGRGEDELSFRRLAAAAGVARSAPYNHFRDRGELLAVLAGEGFGLLHAALISHAGDLSGLARAYLAFGRGQGAHYRVMFLPIVTRPENVAHVHPKAQACFDLLVAALAAAGSTDDEAADCARAIWCGLHGLVLLGEPGGPLGVSPADEARFAELLALRLAREPNRP